MLVTHKTFLSWLLYITVVAFSAIGLIALGLPQLTLAHDHAHLSLVLLLMYVLAEALAGVQAVKISRLNRQLGVLKRWLHGRRVTQVGAAESVFIQTGFDRLTLPPSPFAEHVAALVQRGQAGGQADQRILLDALADKLYHRATIGDFIASRIVWVGILATIAGVIIAFWPFMAAGMNVDAMKANLGGFFSGIAVAFLPTAVSFVFKIALDINTRILTSGVAETVELATVISETSLKPAIEQGRV